MTPTAKTINTAIIIEKAKRLFVTGDNLDEKQALFDELVDVLTESTDKGPPTVHIKGWKKTTEWESRHARIVIEFICDFTTYYLDTYDSKEDFQKLFLEQRVIESLPSTVHAARITEWDIEPYEEEDEA